MDSYQAAVDAMPDGLKPDAEHTLADRIGEMVRVFMHTKRENEALMMDDDQSTLEIERLALALKEVTAAYQRERERASNAEALNVIRTERSKG